MSEPVFFINDGARERERMIGWIHREMRKERGMTITEFLLARIAEDESEAKRWLERESSWDGGSFEVFFAGAPARVLAECEAKRRVVELHTPVNEVCCPLCVDASGHHVIDEPYPCRTLRLIALPYADHPDHDEAWRP